VVGVGEVEAALYRTLADIRGATGDAVGGSDRVAGEIDSLEGVELIIAAEAEFGVRIEDAELTSQICRSIPHMAELVTMKMAGEHGQQGGRDGQRRATGDIAANRRAPATAGRAAARGA